MLPREVEKLFTYANELLEAAEHEANRSAEDVVTHLICTNSRLSLTNYLTGFLYQQDEKPEAPISLQSLLDQCREHDARFDQIDLSPVNCRCQTEGDDYCLDLDKVVDCLKVAQLTRSVVMAKIPGF